VNNDNRASGRHQVSIGHLVMGIAFLFIVGIWALVQTDTVTGDDIHWLLPVPWVLAGVVGLVATAITGSRRYAVRQTGWVGAPTAEPETHLDPEPEPTLDETAPLTAPQNPKNDPDEEIR
jgi:hypothetical protein